MRISKNNLDMLWRIALAQVFTSPSKGPGYDRIAAFVWLQKKGLAGFEGRSVLTPAGRELLEQKLDPDKLAELRRMEARRSNTKAAPQRWPGSIG